MLLLYWKKKQTKKKLCGAFYIWSESAAQRMLRLQRSEELEAER